VTSFIVFLCQLTYVFMLGLQSRNVRDGQYAGAAMVSTVLGVMGLFMTSAIARAAVNGGDVQLALAYIAAGPLGICLAMYLHDKITRKGQ
jgi:hypothetical protein